MNAENNSLYNLENYWGYSCDNTEVLIRTLKRIYNDLNVIL